MKWLFLFFMFVLYSGCYMPDGSVPYTATPEPAPPAMNAATSPPQVWFIVEGRDSLWVADGHSDFQSSSLSVYDSGSVPHKAIYSGTISHINSTLPGRITISLGINEYNPPCDSAQFADFFSSQYVLFSDSTMNGSHIKFITNYQAVFTSVGPPAGGSFQIIDRYYYTNAGISYMKLHIAFERTLYHVSNVYSPMKIKGEGIFVFKEED